MTIVYNHKKYEVVIKYVITRLKNGLDTFNGLPRNRRRNILQQIIKQHKVNGDEYTWVMKGYRPTIDP